MFDLNHNKITSQTAQANAISNLLKTYDISKAIGTDKVFGRFLKNGADELAIPMIHICNLSIKPSHFPKDLKYQSIMWFQSCLSNRNFRVDVKNQMF